MPWRSCLRWQNGCLFVWGQVVLSIAVSWLWGTLWCGNSVLTPNRNVRLPQLAADLRACPSHGNGQKALGLC